MIDNNSDKTMEFAKNTITVLTQNLKQEKALNSELTKRVKELEEMLNDIKKNTNSNMVSLKATSKEKQIIELYARGIPVGFIKKVFDEQLYIDVSIEEIETLIMSLTSNKCSVELMEYYNEMKEIFVKRNTIEKGFFASSLHQKFKMLEDENLIFAGDQFCVRQNDLLFVFTKDQTDYYLKQESEKLIIDNSTFPIIKINKYGGIIAANNSFLKNSDYTINPDGIPCCPNDNNLLMKPEGNTSHLRSKIPTFKFVCPKMKWTKCDDGKYRRRHNCENPCTSSPSGRMVYVYPEKDLRAYPGAIRGTEIWDQTYKIRSTVEQSINHFKDSFCISGRKTQNEKTLHADLLLAGITQLITVVLADKIHKHQYIRSLKPLIA